MALTSKQRAYLRGLAQKIDPIFHVGKSGVTPELTDGVSAALEARELVKLSVLNNCVMDPAEAADMLSGRTRAEVVQVIGKRFVLFRVSKTKPTIELPKEK